MTSVRLLDEHIGLGAGKSWEANPEFDLDPESLRCRSHTDAGFDLGIRRERNALARRDHIQIQAAVGGHHLTVVCSLFRFYSESASTRAGVAGIR